MKCTEYSSILVTMYHNISPLRDCQSTPHNTQSLKDTWRQASTIIKNLSWKNLDIVFSPLVFWLHAYWQRRLWNRPFLQLLDLCDLDLGSGHMAYRNVALIDLYLQTKFRWNWKNFLWTDVQKDGRASGGRLRSRPNKCFWTCCNCISAV